MGLLEIMRRRRSVRQYVPGEIPEEQLRRILQAGMLAPTGKGLRPWAFIVVRDRNTLDALSGCRTTPVPMLRDAACAIAVVGDAEASDVWMEDCSAALTQMHLMADALGLGSCWVQGRLREASDGRSTEAYVRDLLHFPETCRLEAILALGLIDRHPDPHTLEELPMDKIHWETY